MERAGGHSHVPSEGSDNKGATDARVHARKELLGCCGRPRHGPALKQPAMLLVVAGGAQHLLGVLAQRRAGHAVVLAGGAVELDGDAELANPALDARLVERDDHLALAHQLGGERLVEVEQRLQAAVVLAGEPLPLARGCGP